MYTALLLHGDGANNSTTLIDDSLYPKSITAQGNAKISTTESVFGSSSLAFDGSGDYLDINPSMGLAFTNDAFTIEAFIRFSNNTTGMIFGSWDNPKYYMLFCYSGGLGFSYSTSGSWQPANDYYPIACSQNDWHHVAICRLVDGSLLGFVDGIKTVLKGPNSDVFYSGGTPAFKVGGNTNSQWFNGYIEDLRVTNGTALYTDNFTPSITPLTLQSFDIRTYYQSPESDYLDPGAPPTDVLNQIYSKDECRNQLDCYDSCDITYSVAVNPVPILFVRANFVKIEGYVTVEATPASRKVWLLEYFNKRVVRTTWSSPTTGYYSFTDVKAGHYLVWSDDYLKQFKPVSTAEVIT